MPVTQEAVDQFLAQLGAARSITSRKMFGGVGIYADGVFFAVIDDDRLYFKSDALTDPLYDARQAEPWIMMDKVQPYREAQDLEDPAKTADWIALALEVVERKKAKKKKG